MDRHVVLLRELDRARLQHARAKTGQFEHLVITDAIDLARLGHDSRVGREDAVHVGVILAYVGLEHRADCDKRRVAPAAAQRREVAFGRDALEAGDDHDLTLIELLEDPLLVDRLNARL